MSHFARSTDGGTVITTPAPEIKQTNNGLQVRWKLPTGGKVSISEPLVDGRIDRGHFHKGLTEVYTVHKGWIAVFQDTDTGPVIVHLVPDNNCTLVVPPFCKHMVYQPLGAVFITQTLGDPILNPERKNNDWWPANRDFIFFGQDELKRWAARHTN